MLLDREMTILKVPIKHTFLQSLRDGRLTFTFRAPSAVSHILSCRSLGTLLDQESIYVKNFPLCHC